MELGTGWALLLVVALLAALLGRPRRSTGQLPPGPQPLPLLGNLLQLFPMRPLEALHKLRATYGPVFTVHFGRKPVVVLCGHAAVREALVEHADAFAGRAQMPSVDRFFNGHGVVFSNGERWRQLRRFSLSVLHDFGMGKRSVALRIQDEAQALLRELQRTRGEPLEPTALLSQAVSNVICSLVFGERFDYEDAEFRNMMHVMNESFREFSSTALQFFDMSNGLLELLPGPHRRLERLLGRMRHFIAQRVQQHRATLDPAVPRDFIDCFLLQMQKEKDQESSEFNEKNLELTTLNLFFAGTETVSSTLRYGFLLLMKHPEVQEKVQEEIARVVGAERMPNIEDRAHMPYTDAVIHEVQRVSDLVPASVPHMVTRDTHFRGYLLPKGTEVYPLLSTVLHDPTMFAHPDTFDPGHFLAPDGSFRKNEAFVPFSAGKRLCLGEALARMELFLFFTTVLQRFRLQPLVPPARLDMAPRESGLGTVPPLYELRALPR